jgi:heme/copper-type cytochrome/quinol oxidase subunit 2
VTNAEQQRDEIHGFGVVGYNENIVIDPGETKTIKFVADREGVFPYYCTNFCSALHQEMQGYFEVVPRGQKLAQYDHNEGLMRKDAPAKRPTIAMEGHARGHENR